MAFARKHRVKNWRKLEHDAWQGSEDQTRLEPRCTTGQEILFGGPSSVRPQQHHSNTLVERPKLVIHTRGPGGGGGVLPYMGYIGMCRCEGYGFQAVYSSIGYINQSVWV